MDLTKIEQFAFEGIDFGAESAFARRLKLVEGTVSVEIIAVPGGRPVAALEFAHAHVLSLWFDEDESLVWPVDVMRFDSSEISDARWKFVLYGSQVELVWESDWPVKMLPGPDVQVSRGPQTGQKPPTAQTGT